MAMSRIVKNCIGCRHLSCKPYMFGLSFKCETLKITLKTVTGMNQPKLVKPVENCILNIKSDV